MSKSLEALDRIKGHFDTKTIFNKELFTEDFSGIEKELKALEVISNKGLNTNELWYMKNNYLWDTYVESMKELYWGDEDLDKILKTQEEYDLLKEVLSSYEKEN